MKTYTLQEQAFIYALKVWLCSAFLFTLYFIYTVISWRDVQEFLLGILVAFILACVYSIPALLFIYFVSWKLTKYLPIIVFKTLLPLIATCITYIVYLIFNPQPYKYITILTIFFVVYFIPVLFLKRPPARKWRFQLFWENSTFCYHGHPLILLILFQTVTSVL